MRSECSLKKSYGCNPGISAQRLSQSSKWFNVLQSVNMCFSCFFVLLLRLFTYSEKVLKLANIDCLFKPLFCHGPLCLHLMATIGHSNNKQCPASLCASNLYLHFSWPFFPAQIIQHPKLSCSPSKITGYSVY